MVSLSEYVTGLLKPASILLVDDTDSERSVMKRVAKRFNCSLVLAGSVEEALRAFETKTFDLIFLDYRLPDGDGNELFRAIRAVSCNVPICIISGELTIELVQSAQEIGFAVFMNKATDMNLKNLTSLFLTFGIKPKLASLGDALSDSDGI